MFQSFFSALLGFATLSTALVAGVVFTFSVIVMPGLRSLDDRGFIRAFQVIDGVIQGGQALFGLVWVGSILSLSAASVLGLWQLDGSSKWVLLTAGLLYLGGVQLPTFAVNLPLNHELQAVPVAEADEDMLHRARRSFEPSWNRANHVRTFVAVLVSMLLIGLLLLR